MSKKLRIHITNDDVYMENGYTISMRDSGPCWVIDPGLPPQASEILRHIRDRKLTPAAIVLTHAHADHIAGIDEVREAYPNLPVYLAREEWPALTQPKHNLSAYVGQSLATRVHDPRDLPHGSTLELDGTEWNASDVSGHSPGGRALYCAELKIVIVGDALFAGSVGRVDVPHSSGDQLMRNIKNNLLTLPDDTRVLSGHGPETTIGRERTTNPFILYGI